MPVSPLRSEAWPFVDTRPALHLRTRDTAAFEPGPLPEPAWPQRGEAVPTDWAWPERFGPIEPEPAHDAAAEAASPWPRALLMPLAARARGAQMFPRLTAPDPVAERMLATLAEDPAPWLAHRGSVGAALSRQALMQRRASLFLDRCPGAVRLALGAGFTRHDTALGLGPRWIDADEAAVCAWRRRHLAGTAGAQRIVVSIDLRRRAVWRELLGEHAQGGAPWLVLCEGLAGRLERNGLDALLQALGELAPPGSRVLLDIASRAAAGRELGPRTALGHRRDGGLRDVGELIAPHPRLRLDGVFPVLSPRGPLHAAWDLMAWVLAGVPWYAVYELGVNA
jgi:O-methyltransferase involved in polyketide biosynthesis